MANKNIYLDLIPDTFRVYIYYTVGGIKSRKHHLV